MTCFRFGEFFCCPLAEGDLDGGVTIPFVGFDLNHTTRFDLQHGDGNNSIILAP